MGAPTIIRALDLRRGKRNVNKWKKVGTVESARG